MGKNWKGGRGGGGRGGGGGGRGGGGGGGGDISSCKGLSAIIGTCDAARERETSKELVNLFSQIIEENYPLASDSAATEDDDDVEGESIEDMLKKELSEVRNRSHQETQAVISLNTGVKGIVLIKVMRKDIDPVDLVKAVFLKVKTDRQAYSRHVVRLIPLQHVCFPDQEELSAFVEDIVRTKFSPPSASSSTAVEDASLALETESVAVSVQEDPIVEAVDEQPSKKQCVESVASVSSTVAMAVGELDPEAFKAAVYRRLAEKRILERAKTGASSCATHRYAVSFKGRNHNVLTKEQVFALIAAKVPAHYALSMKNAQVPLTSSIS